MGSNLGYVKCGYIGTPERIENEADLNNISLDQNTIKISQAYIDQFSWGVAITMNIDGVYLMQMFYGNKYAVTRQKNCKDNQWSNWVQH